MCNDAWAELQYAVRYALGEYSEPLWCRLEDGLIYNNGPRIVMLNGDPLLWWVTEIIDQVVEAGLYNFWISLDRHLDKVVFQIIGVVNPVDGYYSFNLYHKQYAFYLLLMGLCLSVSVLFSNFCTIDY